ncbi:MAG: hypothetical protein AB7N80_01100 [Bdellovibrionales bacterium]
MTIRLTGIFEEHGDNPLFALKRKKRKLVMRDILMEAMRLLTDKPLTRDELLKLVRFRKRTVMRYVKFLVEIGTIVRSGSGTKGSPFKYMLAEAYRNRPK